MGGRGMKDYALMALSLISIAIVGFYANIAYFKLMLWIVGEK
jgi:hypothetical protein